MTDKKSTVTKPKPLHTVRSGEVRAMISETQSNSGYAYRQITLSREWTSQASGRRAHGSTFFEQHEEDLVKAIRQAAAWLREAHAAPTLNAADSQAGDAH